MSAFADIVMFAWIPIVLFIFTKFKPDEAAIIAFLGAWMFLPMAKYPIPGMPDYTKMSATCYGIFLSSMVFDSQRLANLKIKASDSAIIIFCMAPLFSSLANGLGLYDGIASLLQQTAKWGFPYLIGRMYFGTLEGLRNYAIGIIAGGLVYTPFCLYESRMSPQLHHMFYGFTQATFNQSFRYGGWRPMVFMEHGLMVGMWMASAALAALWLYHTGALKQIRGYGMNRLVPILTLTMVMCRSTGAVSLYIIGAATLLLTEKLKNGLIILLLFSLPVGYLATRSTELWSGQNLVDLIAHNLSEDRAASIEFRFTNENMLSKKALQQPIFGWGGWGRARVYDAEGNDISVTDGLWIIIFGNYGLLGISAMSTVFLLPVIKLLRLYPASKWNTPEVAPAAVLSVLLILYMIDNLLNAMINPIFTVAAGGLTGLNPNESAQISEISVSDDKPPIITRYI
ncbi:MAG: O-antigen ligase domain-containing protein [Desulfobacterales bacterium]|nr:O-antigen ligase domain-containing protein [Desulfobacterales bacterium]MBF0395567.1 O-antigen ligase domain-containing protein [Desulfobacterales bacterium]